MRMRLQTILISLLILAPVVQPLVARAGDSPEVAMVRLLESARRSTVKPIYELRSDLRKERAKEQKDFSNVAANFHKAAESMRSFKKDLEDAGALITGRGPVVTAYFSLVISYYGYLNNFFLAAEASKGQAHSEHFAAVARELQLQVPETTARVLKEFASYDALDKGLDPYDIVFSFAPGDAGKKRVVFSAPEVDRIAMGSFIAFPSKDLAKKQLKLNAFKLLFGEHAVMDTHLYDDELSDASLPADAEAALHSLQSNAEALTVERAFRERLSSALVEPLTSVSTQIIKKNAGAVRNFFVRVANAFPKFSGANAAARKFPSAGEMADLFGENVANDKDGGLHKRRLDSMAITFKTAPQYFTELAAKDIRSTLVELAQLAEADLMKVVLFSFVLTPDKDCGKEGKPACMNELEIRKLEDMTFTFVARLLTADKYSAGLAQPFINALKNNKFGTSLRRYRLADLMIRATLWLSREEKHLLDLEGRDKVPLSMLPDDPEANNVLLAMESVNLTPNNFEAGLIRSGWMMEAMASAHSKIRDAKPEKVEQARVSALGDLLVASDRMMELTTFLSRQADHADIMTAVQNIHKGVKEQYYPYRWNSTRLKLNMLVAKSNHQQVRLTLTALSKLGERAEGIGATSLLRRIHDATKKYLDGDTAPMAEVRALVANGQDFVKSHYQFIGKTFGPPGARIPYLRQILTDPKVFKAYIGFHHQTLAAAMPGLFYEIHLPTYVAPNADTTIDPLTGRRTKPLVPLDHVRPMSVFKLIQRLIGDASCDPAASAGTGTISGCHIGAIARRGGPNLKKNFIDALKTLDRNNLDAPVSLGFTPRELLEDQEVSQRVELVDTSLKGLVSAVITPGKEAVRGDDSLWPETFKVRDVLPAINDKETDAATGQKVHPDARIMLTRAVVSAFLAPYMRTASQANKLAVKALLDPKGDHGKMLVRSRAYSELVEKANADTGEMLDEIKNDELYWHLLWEKIKAGSTETQAYSNYLFMGSIYLPLPKMVDELGMIFMLGSSVVDFGMDVCQLADYGTTYSATRPFTNSGMLSEGLFANEELQRLRQEFHQKAEIIWDRAPMDLYWYAGQIGNWRMKHKFGRQRKMDEQAAAEHNTQMLEFLGLKPGATAEEVTAAIEKRAAAQNAATKIELQKLYDSIKKSKEDESSPAMVIDHEGMMVPIYPKGGFTVPVKTVPVYSKENCQALPAGVACGTTPGGK